jgi:hypothetical protein
MALAGAGCTEDSASQPTGNQVDPAPTAPTTVPKSPSAPPEALLAAVAPEEESGEFDGAFLPAESTAQVIFEIVPGHAELKVIIKGDHTVDGAIAASLKGPSGTEVAADTGSWDDAEG